MTKTLLSLLVITTLSPTTITVSSTASEVVDCYKAFSSAYFCDTVGNCSMKHKFVPVTLKFTNRCVGALVHCQIQQETLGTDQTACFAKAQNQCNSARNGRQQYDGGRFAAQRENIVDKCNELDFGDDILAVDGGIGFDNDEQVCTDIGTPLASVGDLSACSDTWLQCQVEALVATLTPRAREVLEANGWKSAFAPAECMEPAVSADASGMNDITLLACQKNLSILAESFVKRKMVLMEECVDELFRCKVREERGELAGAPLQECVTTAEALCSAKVAKITAAENALRSKFMQRCGGVALDDLRTGLGFQSPDHPCGGETTSEELIGCLVDSLACRLDGIVGHLKPRTAELLNDAGLSSAFDCLQ
jgi:hypothetical protein